MTPKEFVNCFVEEKGRLLETWTNNSEPTHVGALISELSLSDTQTKELGVVLDAVLTDAFYTVLLALDGAASLGSCQVDYQLLDERGNALTGSGEIEAEAFSAFHEDL